MIHYIFHAALMMIQRRLHENHLRCSTVFVCCLKLFDTVVSCCKLDLLFPAGKAMQSVCTPELRDRTTIQQSGTMTPSEGVCGMHRCRRLPGFVLPEFPAPFLQRLGSFPIPLHHLIQKTKGNVSGCCGTQQHMSLAEPDRAHKAPAEVQVNVRGTPIATCDRADARRPVPSAPWPFPSVL